MILIIFNVITSDMMISTFIQYQSWYGLPHYGTVPDGACRMNEAVTFSLSYEQLTRETEEAISQCDLNLDGIFYNRELSKASALILFWHRLAIVGYQDVTGNERVEADLQRLKALIFGKKG